MNRLTSSSIARNSLATKISFKAKYQRPKVRSTRTTSSEQIFRLLDCSPNRLKSLEDIGAIREQEVRWQDIDPGCMNEAQSGSQEGIPNIKPSSLVPELTLLSLHSEKTDDEQA